MSKADAIPPMAKTIGIGGVLIILLSFLYQEFDLRFLSTQEAGGIRNSIGTYYKVTKVTDGNTLHINIDGADERVRLIGINTPEATSQRKEDQCFGKEATKRMEKLAHGNLVRLEYDDSQGMRDTYDRLLAYVYLEDGQMVNRKMIAEGYAYEYTYLTPYTYRDEFRDLQKLARASERGLWNPALCSGAAFFSK